MNDDREFDVIYVPHWISDDQLDDLNRRAIGWTGPNSLQIRFVRYIEWRA